MLYLIYGTDRLAVRERRDAVLGEHLPAGGDDLALTRLDGQKCSADDLARAVQALPFFGDRRVVLVDDLLTRFESKRRGRGAAGSGDESGAGGDADEAPPLAGKHDPSRPFAAALAGPAPTTVTILWERGALLKANPLLKALGKAATVQVYDAPKIEVLDDWIFDRARKKGIRLTPEVPRLLAEHLGQDLEVLDGELDKLGAYAGEGRAVDPAMVRLLTAQTRQADTLQLLNAAADHHPAEALGLLHELLDHGVAPVAVIGMLGSQVRKLLQVQALTARHLPAAEIAARLEMHPYATRLAVDSLRYYTVARLQALHGRLVATDQAVKTGQTDGEAALELLVLDLARR